MFMLFITQRCNKMMRLFHHFACICILVVRQVNTLATGAHYLRPRRKAVRSLKKLTNMIVDFPSQSQLTLTFSSPFFFGHRQCAPGAVQFYPIFTRELQFICYAESNVPIFACVSTEQQKYNLYDYILSLFLFLLSSGSA